MPELFQRYLLERYSDEHLQALCNHYPQQFEHLVKINQYYFKQLDESQLNQLQHPQQDS